MYMQGIFAFAFYTSLWRLMETMCLTAAKKIDFQLREIYFNIIVSNGIVFYKKKNLSSGILSKVSSTAVRGA